MIYLLTSIIYLVKGHFRITLTNFLFFMLFSTSISAYLVGRQPSADIVSFLLSLYTVVLLSMAFLSFRPYERTTNVLLNVNKSRLSKCESLLTILVVGVIFFQSYIFINLFSQLMVGLVTVDEHKNGGGATAFFDSVVPHVVMTYINTFSPLGFICLSLHFYYLIQGNISKTIRFLFLSFAIVLSSFLALSRSAVTEYILIYTALFCLFSPVIKHSIKKKILKVSLFFFLAIGVVFYLISASRFSAYYTKNSENTAIIDETNNPVAFSLFDYFSQWEENGLIIMKMYKPEYKFWGTYNSCGLLVFIESKMTNPNIYADINERMEKYVGRQWMMFHGLIARLIYDFGYIGTIIFMIIYSILIKKFRPLKGNLSFNSVLALPLLVAPISLFWAGNMLVYVNVDMAIIYSIFFWKYIKNNKKCLIKQKEIV